MSLAEMVARRVSSLCAPAVVVDVLDSAFTVGAAIRPRDLLPGGEECEPLWEELAARLTGEHRWHAEIGWIESAPQLILLPPGKTTEDYDRCTAWWLTVESYGDGTVNIHGCAPTPRDAPQTDLRSFDTVDAALLALTTAGALHG